MDTVHSALPEQPDSASAATADGPPSAAGPSRAPAPHPRLQDLDVLEGKWRLEGYDATSGHAFIGTVTRRWLPGGFFMTQQTSTDGRPEDGTEYSGTTPQPTLSAPCCSAERGLVPSARSRWNTSGRSEVPS